MIVQDYILSAEWCYDLEPTDSKGKYLLITSITLISKAHEWLNKNLEPLFIDYIPHYGTFNLMEGYKYPKCSDKPHYSSQLGTYADKL